VELDQTGFWRVLAGAGRERRIAVNVDRRESDLAPAAKEDLDLWAKAAAAAGQGSGGPPPARPLAMWLLGAALAAAVVEMALAAHYLGKEAA
jgi:hypothetical protein